MHNELGKASILMLAEVKNIYFNSLRIKITYSPYLPFTFSSFLQLLFIQHRHQYDSDYDTNIQFGLILQRKLILVLHLHLVFSGNIELEKNPVVIIFRLSKKKFNGTAPQNLSE